jgi:hypothetical protein
LRPFVAVSQDGSVASHEKSFPCKLLVAVAARG